MTLRSSRLCGKPFTHGAIAPHLKVLSSKLPRQLMHTQWSPFQKGCAQSVHTRGEKRHRMELLIAGDSTQVKAPSLTWFLGDQVVSHSVVPLRPGGSSRQHKEIFKMLLGDLGGFFFLNFIFLSQFFGSKQRKYLISCLGPSPWRALKQSLLSKD